MASSLPHMLPRKQLAKHRGAHPRVVRCRVRGVESLPLLSENFKMKYFAEPQAFPPFSPLPSGEVEKWVTCH